MSAEIEFTEDNFRSEIAEGVVLVDFWAPWCGPCKMQGPIIEALAEEMQGKAKIGKCNVDDARSVAAELGVHQIPTLMIFKDGELVERLIGLKSKEDLTDKIQAHLDS